MKRMRKTKTILVLAMVVLVLACAVGGTIAFLIDTTGTVTNTFTPAKVTCAVNEEFNGTTKNNVKIQNTGTTDAWIRATVVANWVVGSRENAKVVAPCVVEFAPGAGWAQDESDGYYYYSQIVPPAPGNNTTADLITRYTAPTGGPEGAHLEMTIVCQAVQSNLGSSAQAAFAKAAAGN